MMATYLGIFHGHGRFIKLYGIFSNLKAWIMILVNIVHIIIQIYLQFLQTDRIIFYINYYFQALGHYPCKWPCFSEGLLGAPRVHNEQPGVHRWRHHREQLHHDELHQLRDDEWWHERAQLARELVWRLRHSQLEQHQW